jgi:hypothetical protein
MYSRTHNVVAVLDARQQLAEEHPRLRLEQVETRRRRDAVEQLTAASVLHRNRQMSGRNKHLRVEHQCHRVQNEDTSYTVQISIGESG